MLNKIEKMDKKLNIKEKIILAQNKRTPINVLDELLLEDISEVRIEIYKRKDFKEIKYFLKNLNEKEYEFFEISINTILKFIRFEFSSFKVSYIAIIVILSFVLCISLEITEFLIMSRVFLV